MNPSKERDLGSIWDLAPGPIWLETDPELLWGCGSCRTCQANLLERQVGQPDQPPSKNQLQIGLNQMTYPTGSSYLTKRFYSTKTVRSRFFSLAWAHISQQAIHYRPADPKQSDLILRLRQPTIESAKCQPVSIQTDGLAYFCGFISHVFLKSDTT